MQNNLIVALEYILVFLPGESNSINTINKLVLLLLTPVLHKTSAIGIRTLQNWKEYEAPKLTRRSKKDFC